MQRSIETEWIFESPEFNVIFRIKAMRIKWANKLVSDLPKEERNLINFKEIPCKDMDLDCLALDGRIPFGNYKKCYEYAPELGKCLFHEWEKDGSTEDH